MPGDFDFLSDEPKPKPKSLPAKKAEPIVERIEEPDPPQAEAVEEEELAFASGDDTRHTAAPGKSKRQEPKQRPKRGDDDAAPPRKKGLSPTTLVMIGGPALLVFGGAIALVLIVRAKDPEAKEKDKGGSTLVVTVPSTPPTKKEVGDPNSPSPEVVAKVKKATILVRVLFKDGKGAEGSGFVEKNSGLIVTNAHVVGLLKVKDSPWKIINLVVYSGQGDREFTLAGIVEDGDFDSENDLALIHPKIIEIGERHALPEGLAVARNPPLAELQNLFVFGFPLGTSIGAEISVRPTKITSLRQDKNGKLKAIQVEGGMTHGNSGGPVVDVKGSVVGVAVSGIKDAAINFAVPSEKVVELLARRNK
jgi:S1-C subfamily serine protease